MKRPYNTSADFFFGPGTTTPGVFITTAPCRLIANLHSEFQVSPYIYCEHYLTLDAYFPGQPQGVTIEPIVIFDKSTANEIALPSGGPINYRVLLVETVTPISGAPYYRCHIESKPYH